MRRNDGYKEIFKKTINCEKCQEQLLEVRIGKELTIYSNRVKLSGFYRCPTCGEYSEIEIDQEF